MSYKLWYVVFSLSFRLIFFLISILFCLTNESFRGFSKSIKLNVFILVFCSWFLVYLSCHGNMSLDDVNAMNSGICFTGWNMVNRYRGFVYASKECVSCICWVQSSCTPSRSVCSQVFDCMNILARFGNQILKGVWAPPTMLVALSHHHLVYLWTRLCRPLPVGPQSATMSGHTWLSPRVPSVSKSACIACPGLFRCCSKPWDRIMNQKDNIKALLGLPGR